MREPWVSSLFKIYVYCLGDELKKHIQKGGRICDGYEYDQNKLQCSGSFFEGKFFLPRFTGIFFLARFTGNSIFTIYQLLTNFNEYYPGIPSDGDIKETNKEYKDWKTYALGGLGESKANNILFKAMKPADHVAMKSGQQSNY